MSRKKSLGGWSAPFAPWVHESWARLSKEIDGERIAAEVRANLTRARDAQPGAAAVHTEIAPRPHFSQETNT